MNSSKIILVLASTAFASASITSSVSSAQGNPRVERFRRRQAQERRQGSQSFEQARSAFSQPPQNSYSQIHQYRSQNPMVQSTKQDKESSQEVAKRKEDFRLERRERMRREEQERQRKRESENSYARIHRARLPQQRHFSSSAQSFQSSSEQATVPRALRPPAGKRKVRFLSEQEQMPKSIGFQYESTKHPSRSILKTYSSPARP